MRAVLALLAALLSGCVLVAAAIIGGALAAGSYSYVNGEGVQDYRVSYDKLYSVTLSLAEKRGIEVTDKGTDKEKTAWVKGKLKSGPEAHFRIEKLTDNTARLGIRIGTWGDEKITADLHNEIGRELEARYK